MEIGFFMELLALMMACTDARSSGLEPETGACLCFSANSVNIRSEPDIGSTSIELGYKGDCYTFTGEVAQTQDGYTWYQFDFTQDQIHGYFWSVSNYLQVSPESKCGPRAVDQQVAPPQPGTCLCFTADGVSIRKEPGLNDEAVGTANKGECYNLTGIPPQNLDGYTWYFINFTSSDQIEYEQYWAAGAYLEIAPSVQCALFKGNKKCLECICQIESNCQPLGCHFDVTADSCGYYQIQKKFYNACGAPGLDWKSCSRNKTCSEICVTNYMEIHAHLCTMSRYPFSDLKCEAAVRVHNGGPRSCQYCMRKPTNHQWKKVKACLEEDVETLHPRNTL